MRVFRTKSYILNLYGNIIEFFFSFQRTRHVDIQRYLVGNELADQHVAQDVFVMERKRRPSIRCRRQLRHRADTVSRFYGVPIAVQGTKTVI